MPNPHAKQPRRHRQACACAAFGFLLAAISATAPGSAAEPVTAVWQPREVAFSYNSTRSVYSCKALADRVAVILRAVGARDDVKVRLSDCYTPAATVTSRPSDSPSRGAWEVSADRTTAQTSNRRQFVHVYLDLMMPTEVTPEVLAALKKDKARRELISRTTGDPVERFNDPVPFAAQRQELTLSRTTLGLEPAECELLDQMSSSVFRDLGVRVVRRGASCTANSRLPPEVVVEALAAMPPPLEEPLVPGGGATSPAPEAPQDAAPEREGQ